MNENLNLKDIFARLAAPFHPEDIEWRAGATNCDKTRALALAYITSRAVMDRLDEVIGPENWHDEYAPGPDGGVICGLSLRLHNEWITKWDGAENTDFEAIKGGLSDAFKRAGYKWGIGRYLYKLESAWVPCEAHGKSISLKSTPVLPSWALPDEWVTQEGKKASRIQWAHEEQMNGSPANPPTPSTRSEQDILKELGFAPKLVPEPILHPPVPVVPGPSSKPSNGSNGNGKPQPAAAPSNGKRTLSWGMNQVETLLKAKLAANPVEAVRMLNESDLPQSATPEQILAHFKS